MTLSSTPTHQPVTPHLPPDSAQSYICDMLKELTQIAQQAELDELTSLLRITTIAADTHKRIHNQLG